MDSSSIKENGINKDLQRTEHNAPTPVNQKTIGIDLGDRWSRYCILGGDGQIVEEDRNSHKHRRMAAAGGPTIDVVTSQTGAIDASRGLYAGIGEGAEATAKSFQPGGTVQTAKIPEALIKANARKKSGAGHRAT